MATIRLIFALIGMAILFAVVAAAIRSDSDRLGEGLVIGIYVGVLGSISLLVILKHLGVL